MAPTLIGCHVILTVCGSNTSSHLTAEFVEACQTAHLSRLATEKTQGLPLAVWTMDSTTSHSSSAFLSLLQFHLAHLPATMLLQCQSLPSDLQPVVFNLVVIHTAVTMLPKAGGRFVPVHYSILLACITRLVSMHEGRVDQLVILHSLGAFIKHVYCACISSNQFDAIVTASLHTDTCSASGGMLRPLPGVEIVTPTSDPIGYLDHTLKLSRGNEKGSSEQVSWGCFCSPLCMPTLYRCCVCLYNSNH